MPWSLGPRSVASGTPSGNGEGLQFGATDEPQEDVVWFDAATGLWLNGTVQKVVTQVDLRSPITTGPWLASYNTFDGAAPIAFTYSGGALTRTYATKVGGGPEIMILTPTMTFVPGSTPGWYRWDFSVTYTTVCLKEDRASTFASPGLGCGSTTTVNRSHHINTYVAVR
jgi:hypothetical protein